jgi:hypothetical protein
VSVVTSGCVLFFPSRLEPAEGEAQGPEWGDEEDEAEKARVEGIEASGIEIVP